jgi:hypothetical protein
MNGHPPTFPPLTFLLDYIAERIADRIVERLDEVFEQEPPPALLDTSRLARELGVSTTHISKLARTHGLPHVMIGDCRRYELARVLDFLRAGGPK